MIKRAERISVADSIVEQLLGLIREGHLKPGDRVPAEHELVESFGVGRTSVREALKVLEVMGIVERKKTGTIVTSDPSSQALNQLLVAEFAADRLDVRDLFDVRRLLEGEMVARAAASATEESLAELRRLCSIMERVGKEEFDRFFDLDMQFHLQLAKACGNPVLVRLWNVVQELLGTFRQRASRIPNIIETSNRNHRLIMDALERNDPAAARATMDEVLDMAELLFVDAPEEERA